MGTYELKDSGKREIMPTGSQRDSQEGKGRYSLIPPGPMRRLAVVYEKGGARYGDFNWQKGQKITRLLDSTLRHIYQYMDGEQDEDHLGHAAWGLFALMWTEVNLPEMQDLPAYNKKLSGQKAAKEPRCTKCEAVLTTGDGAIMCMECIGSCIVRSWDGWWR